TEGACAFLLECLQNSAASGVGDGVQEAIEIGSGVSHSFLLFHDRIVPIADQAGAHGFGVFPLGVGSDLNVIKLVGRRIVRNEGWILLLFQCLGQRLGVFLPVDGGDLHIVTGG